MSTLAFYSLLTTYLNAKIMIKKISAVFNSVGLLISDYLKATTTVTVSFCLTDCIMGDQNRYFLYRFNGSDCRVVKASAFGAVD